MQNLFHHERYAGFQISANEKSLYIVAATSLTAINACVNRTDVTSNIE
jgi:hypothetical protein